MIALAIKGGQVLAIHSQTFSEMNYDETIKLAAELLLYAGAIRPEKLDEQILAEVRGEYEKASM